VVLTEITVLKAPEKKSQEGGDQDGKTLCAKVKDDMQVTIKLGEFTLQRAPVAGDMSSVNILNACKKKDMSPVCNGPDTMDGHCKLVTGFQLSDTAKCRANGVPTNLVYGAYFYSAALNGGRATINNNHNTAARACTECGTTSEGTPRTVWDRDGDTFCISSNTSMAKAVWQGFDIHRVKVAGEMTRANMKGACALKGLLPVCNHPDNADGTCVLVGGVTKFDASNPAQTAPKGIPRAITLGAYTYCGRNKCQPIGSKVDIGTGSRSATVADKDGDALCTNEQATDDKNFQWSHGYLMKRIPTKGQVTKESLKQACKNHDPDAKPVCDSAGDADGQCYITGATWKWSDPIAVTKFRAPIEKVVGAYFYGRPNPRLNRGDRSAESSPSLDRDGDAFCAVRTKEYKSQVAWRNLVISRVGVGGANMNTNFLVEACKQKKLKPLCDHANSANGQCVIAAGEDWYFSNPQQSKLAGHDVPRGLVQGAFVYSTERGVRSSMDQGDKARWSTDDDKYGETLCSKYDLAQSNFTWNDYLFVRTNVEGEMTSNNIRTACEKVNMRPACDRKSYSDDNCEVISGSWHLSKAPKAFDIPKQKVLGAYFYCGNSNGGLSLLNTGVTHKWSGQYDQTSRVRHVTDHDGDTFCAKRQRSGPVSTNWRGVEMHRIAVKGEMNSVNIIEACDQKDMKPLCAHPSYSDGQCYLLTSQDWHFSRPQDTKGKGLTRKLLASSFFYAGIKHGLDSLMDTGKDHRWSTSRDKNEDTVCIKDTRPKKESGGFEFQGYKFKRVMVDGPMVSEGMLKACDEANAGAPVCEHPHYADGKCSIVGGPWHMSDPVKIAEYNLPMEKMKGAYFYTGHVNTGKAPNKLGLGIQCTGTSQKWAAQQVDGTVWDKKGDTLCVQRTAQFPKEFMYGDFTLTRIHVKGAMNSKTIYSACQAMDPPMRPVCNHANYADGRCIIAGGDWHVSKPSDAIAHNLQARLLLQGAFTYCGYHNGQRSLLDQVDRHRWSKDTDQDGETICSYPSRVDSSFELNKYLFQRLLVKGPMTSGNILKTCQKLKMHPVCDHENYADGLCRSVGGQWHFSHPTQAKANGVPEAKITGAYFYCGEDNKGRALMNNGLTHRWTKDVNGKIWDKDGDTYCVKRSKNFSTKITIGKIVMHLVQVEGEMTSENLIESCKKLDMKPVCNGPKYSDGRCILVAAETINDLAKSPRKLKTFNQALQTDPKMTRGVYLYAAQGKDYNGMAIMDAVQEHRFATTRDQNGDTFCAKPDDTPVDFNKYHMIRTKVEGRMTAANILKACQASNTRPVCDSADIADGQCRIVGGDWNFADINHVDKAQFPFQKKLAGTYFYAGADKVKANVLDEPRDVILTKDKKVWDMGGDTWCANRSKDFVLKWEYRNQTITREEVKGSMTSNNAFAACENAGGKRPVCNSILVADGRCIAIGGNAKMSVNEQTKKLFSPDIIYAKDQYGQQQATKGKVRIPKSLLQGAFTYLGAGKMTMLDKAKGEKLAGRSMKNGETLCIDVNRTADSNWTFNHWTFDRVRVVGKMTGENLIDACALKRMRPVCEHADFADGRCRIAGGAWHMAVTKDQERYGLNSQKVRNAYFYAGTANGGLTIMATGLDKPDHLWSKKDDMDGDTFCVSRPAGFKTSATYNSHHLARTPVVGHMTGKNLIKACAERKMKPVCNHINDADGQCVIVGGKWHISDPKKGSHQEDTVGARIPRQLLQGVFMYSGDTKGDKTRLDMQSKHRWSNSNDREGDTLCSPTNYTAHEFSFNDYNFFRVPVKGLMTSSNIIATCQERHMRPVCDIGTAADGTCRIVGGDDWRFSHYEEAKKNMGPNAVKLRGAYFYTGAENGQMSSMNNGVTHQWAKVNRDRNGDTFCVQRGKSFVNSFEWQNHTMERVEVKGSMTSSNILATCASKDMRPVCNNANYADGQCIIVGGEWHMSLEDHRKGHDLPRSMLRGTFTYCGNVNAGWSYLDTGTNHRWSRGADKDGDTLCVRPDRQDKIFKKGEYQFVRVEVKDFMTAANILKTCEEINMKPVCESIENSDHECRSIGKWHMAYPAEVSKHLSQTKIKGAYFYCGLQKNGGSTLMNNGVRHVWSKDRVDRNGDTFCVQHSSMAGHGDCNCPSVNSLMVRAGQIRKICAEKQKREEAEKNQTNGTKLNSNFDPVDELGDADDDETQSRHMARIAKEATPDQSQYLGESMHSSMQHLLGKDCANECGDVRGLVRQIFERERDCGLLKMNFDDPH